MDIGPQASPLLITCAPRDIYRTLGSGIGAPSFSRTTTSWTLLTTSIDFHVFVPVTGRRDLLGLMATVVVLPPASHEIFAG